MLVVLTVTQFKWLYNRQPKACVYLCKVDNLDKQEIWPFNVSLLYTLNGDRSVGSMHIALM